MTECGCGKPGQRDGVSRHILRHVQHSMQGNVMRNSPCDDEGSEGTKVRGSKHEEDHISHGRPFPSRATGETDTHDIGVTNVRT